MNADRIAELQGLIDNPNQIVAAVSGGAEDEDVPLTTLAIVGTKKDGKPVLRAKAEPVKKPMKVARVEGLTTRNDGSAPPGAGLAPASRPLAGFPSKGIAGILQMLQDTLAESAPLVLDITIAQLQATLCTLKLLGVQKPEASKITELVQSALDETNRLAGKLPEAPVPSVEASPGVLSSGNVATPNTEPASEGTEDPNLQAQLDAIAAGKVSAAMLGAGQGDADDEG